jgi:hypothetical protein
LNSINYVKVTMISQLGVILPYADIARKKEIYDTLRLPDHP